MEFSAFEVYLFMSVDSLRYGIGVPSGVIIFITNLVGAVFYDESINYPSKRVVAIKLFKLNWIFIPLFCLAVLMPSQKTIAAMYAIPKLLASDTVKGVTSTIGEDGIDIYKLGIEAVKDALTTE